MKLKLAEALINRGIIQPGTLAYGKTLTAGLGQTPQMIPMELMIEELKNNAFHCCDRLGTRYIMLVEDVEQIDGMDPVRLASVYDIRSDGSNKLPSKKRGRKPKSAQINILEGESNGQNKRTDYNNQTQSSCT